jgi:hypothetical protein
LSDVTTGLCVSDFKVKMRKREDDKEYGGQLQGSEVAGDTDDG